MRGRCRSDDLGHLWLVSGTGSTQMEIHCVCESVHIIWNKTNLNTSELEPEALISIHILPLLWWYEEGDYSPQVTSKGPCTHED